MNLLQKIKGSVLSKQQAYLAENFEKSKYGKELVKLKNIHKGEKCFIIGNGPSLKIEDLTKLYENKIPCFASNNILKAFDKTKWRPTYYVCEDLFVLQDIGDKISETQLNRKFIPINFKWFNDINIKDATYYYIWFKKDYDKRYCFSDNIADRVFCDGTVTITCIEIAAYMGFKEIYLLGIDHNYRQTIDNDGNIKTDETVKDYFDDKYVNKKAEKNIPNLQVTTEAYGDVKEHCDKLGIKIFNATRGGKLEVYPRKSFDSIFENL